MSCDLYPVHSSKLRGDKSNSNGAMPLVKNKLGASLLLHIS